ncbi:6-hydroxynicotinate 3-monooxygenase-like protein [Cladobotryum mycophilum]|uniref:6-hydroxynicotinate 3-monooxygenase-like protein n=1 Tax=Cladobotryum mycophilum TaxID=491253 RepID=A0ABR0SRE2_9HYPO
MSHIQKAIIIGAGPAGLAAALRLKMFNGIDSTVYEVRSEPTTLGGAVYIPSNGLSLLNRLNVFDELASRAFASPLLKIHSMQGSILGEVDMVSWSREKLGFGLMRVLRSDLVDILLGATEKNNIPVHFGKSLMKITEDENHVTIEFSDGTTETADVLLGCDGIHSTVRKLHVSPEVEPEYTGLSTMFSILPTSHLSEQHRSLDSALHVTLTPEGMFAVTPCTASGDKLYWFYSREVAIPGGEDNREGWEAFSKKEVEGFKDNLQRVIRDASGEWAGRMREVIYKTDTIKFYPVYTMPPAAIWSTKRCLLLGDAAHAMPPHAGQGTSMALEDVFMLSRLLENSSNPLSEVFRMYEAIRRPRVEAIARISASNGDMRRTLSPFGHKMKEVAVGVGFWLYNATGLQKWAVGMNQKDYAYDIMAESIE